MSTSDIVKRLCHQFNEEALAKQAIVWSQASLSVSKDVISWIKKIIKDKREVPVSRLMALKVTGMQLLHQCMLKRNVEFVMFAAKKIMSRLTILAGHKKTIRDLSRGEDIFGAISLASEQSRAASVEFLRCLLLYIRIWAKQFGRLADGSPSVYLMAYTKLTSSGVTFPVEDGADSSTGNPSPRRSLLKPLTPQEIDTISSSALLLSEILSQPDPDSDTVSELSSQLKGVPERIEAELRIKTEQRGMEDYVAQLIELNDYVRGALQKCEAVKPVAPLPRSQTPVNFRTDADHSLPPIDQEELEFQRAMSASLLPVSRSPMVSSSPSSPSPPSLPAADSISLESQITIKESMLKTISEELMKAKREAMEYAQSADMRMTMISQAKSESEAKLKSLQERQQLEINIKIASQTSSSVLKSRLTTSSKQLQDLKDRLKDKEIEHRAIVKALSSAQEEHKRLTAALAAPLDSQEEEEFATSPASAVYSSQEFESMRASIPSLVPPLILRPEISVYAQRQPDNCEYLVLAGLSPKGVLYSTKEIEIGFMFKQSQTLLLYIGNKGQSEIRQLHTFVCDFPSSGISLSVNKEMEEQAIASMSKVNRTVNVKKVGVCGEIPRMVITFL